MRRMYSKEQLQKLIDEVSRLIAIEELDKVVPVPTLADAGKVMVVNAQGTGYALANAEPILIEDIVDANGNKRFVEGNITTQSVEGISYTYAKWSLSGTHLMIVFAGTIADNTSLSSEDVFGSVAIPSYIGTKIFPMTSNNILERKDISILGNTAENINQFNAFIQKAANTELKLGHYGNETITTGGIFRVVFDLLIDNAQ